MWRKAVYLTDRYLWKWVFIHRRMTFSWLWCKRRSPKKGVSQGIFKILQKHLSGERWCKLFKYNDVWVNNIALLVLWIVQMLLKNVTKLTLQNLKEWNDWTHTPTNHIIQKYSLYIMCEVGIRYSCSISFHSRRLVEVNWYQSDIVCSFHLWKIKHLITWTFYLLNINWWGSSPDSLSLEEFEFTME